MSNCRWAGSTQPRMLRGHVTGCDNPTCPGCQPCTERHCGICGIEHVTADGHAAEQTCATCIGVVREDLANIVTMSTRLLSEAICKGVASEAANLAGPSIDTTEGHEAYAHRAMSAAFGRIPALEDDERHPLWVLGTWEVLLREHYDQPDQRRITIARARAYLDGHLSRVAHDVDFAFEEMARDIRNCRGHLEDVLHDGERDERTQVPCLDCAARLVRKYGETAADDHHACPRCGRRYDVGEFARAKAEQLSTEQADRYVLLADAASAIDRSEFTVRTWVRRESVGAMCNRQTHRLMVWWPDVRDQHREAKLRELRRVMSPVGYSEQSSG